MFTRTVNLLPELQDQATHIKPIPITLKLVAIV